VKKNRPTNISPADLTKFSWPITAISSGLHRITGILLFLCIPFCLWALQMSLTATGFVEIKSILSGVVPKLIMWAILSMLSYHIVAGIRHLLMDVGIGESLEGARLGSYISIISGVIVTAVLGVWIW
jgi:succinate dehydrogenase / fumarate reductase, cytochrome b subunit